MFKIQKKFICDALDQPEVLESIEISGGIGSLKKYKSTGKNEKCCKNCVYWDRGNATGINGNPVKRIHDECEANCLYKVDMPIFSSAMNIKRLSGLKNYSGCEMESLGGRECDAFVNFYIKTE